MRTALLGVAGLVALRGAAFLVGVVTLDFAGVGVFMRFTDEINGVYSLYSCSVIDKYLKAYQAFRDTPAKAFNPFELESPSLF